MGEPHGINIGSGPHYAPGWLNIDITPTDTGTQPDLLIDIHALHHEFDHHQFAKAYVGHVLEHIPWGQALTDAIHNIAYVAPLVVVVGPCMNKAVQRGEPEELLAAIRALDPPYPEPWAHQWTPTEELTVQAIIDAGYTPEVIDVATVCKPEWPNPSTVGWQTAIRFTTEEGR